MNAVHTLENDINKKCLLLENRRIFMPIGKSGSTSVKRSLVREGIHFKLITKDEILRYYMDFVKVTVVRNPYERLVSAYSYFTQKRGKEVLNINFTDFPSFVEAVYNEPDEISNCHFRSQVNLLSQDNIFLPDIVIDLSQIEEIKKYLPIENLEHNPKTKSSHKDYRDYYTYDLIQMVEERYYADLTEFGYGFNEYRKAEIPESMGCQRLS